MRKAVLRPPSPAMVVALIALFVAMGGTGYAALKLSANSVGTRQLKKGAVTTSKLHRGAVTGSQVASNSLTGAQINASTLGTVPNAANAAHATNSEQLGGLGSGLYQLSCPGGKAVQILGSASESCTDTVANATNATNASNAANATNASHATNSDQLGASPASAYLKGTDSITTGDLGGTYSAPTLNTGSVVPSKFGTIPGVRARNSGGTNISDSTLTPLTFDTNDYDNDSMHSTSTNTSRLVAPIDGVYEVTGDVIWHPNATGTRVLYITKNGSTDVAYTEVPVNSSGTDTGQQATTQVNLGAGDYVQLRAYQNSGSTIIISGLSDISPIFAMHWMGP